MFQDITIEELLALKDKKEIIMIDVRSPSEYRDATIPDSLNIPFFDDEERAEIGTLYKQVSVRAAKDRGLEIVAAKLPDFVKRFERLPGQKAVFCWRGGMRSHTTATVLALMGIRTYRLTGGFRSYRKWVVDMLEHIEFQPRGLVVSGNTGSGKTAILRRLQEEGYPALDLEAMAGHRGSIFGHVGLRANNQKTFEALLVSRLLELKESPYFLVEGESKRIGKAVIPGFIMDKKENGLQLFIEMPIEVRARHIMEEYRPSEHKHELLQAFGRIKERIHTPIAKEIDTLLQEDRFEEAIILLLAHYYDPRYAHAMNRHHQERCTIRVNSVEEAIEEVKRFLQAEEKDGAFAEKSNA
ncbi:tRNA 2-selenouridine(34) synthase MnmH [Paenibacillus sacheonensis]|uniref:tRNA 2-selenouridine(34) synthase MnmH n=1 Tax=Paenibacillus sacheonensis TaxID=742054 RepID=A0A7X4YN15_9BACL|nr:tRNA 2-selenouridine(34) synthase MnmH [Paenibacillus sacheonensis]MBM7564823.1 tRNA 2-selenouridine synthase [Paenibacillus sacheonensis]NBC69371.1 tRNA 2-selenouridine(34) synthase MnmH [Paenibacillus sacheonensis]